MRKAPRLNVRSRGEAKALRVGYMTEKGRTRSLTGTNFNLIGYPL